MNGFAYKYANYTNENQYHPSLCALVSIKRAALLCYCLHWAWACRVALFLFQLGVPCCFSFVSIECAVATIDDPQTAETHTASARKRQVSGK
jgi:hypothetical protein